MAALAEYRMYCTHQEIQKALCTLKGILSGIQMDFKINDAELAELFNWCNLQRDYIEFKPFSEIIPKVEQALEDNIITHEEYGDILWLCNNYLDDKIISDTITASIQILHGVLHGILADGILNDIEIKQLHFWLKDFNYLEGTYPYDELKSLVTQILADNKVSDEERMALKAFIANFIDTKTSLNISEKEVAELRSQYHIDGICATNPKIEIQSKVFCFTGESAKVTRKEFEHIVWSYGGTFGNSVTKQTEYLIVGCEGNPCWMFSCYGRKVEKAVELRKRGQALIIVHENDFWNALETAEKCR